MRRNTVIALLVLAALAAAFLSLRSGPRLAGAGRAAPRPRAALLAPRSAPHANPNRPYQGPPNEDGPSELTVGLNSPTTDIHADLRLVNDLFMHYRSAVHGQNPVGENADITAVLMGRNPLGFAFIPPGCPAVNGGGELCDRWGTPFFFHALSGEQMEIRSAGPDRKMWTEDDQVLTP